MNRNQKLIMFLIIIAFIVLAWIYGRSIFNSTIPSEQNGTQALLFASKVGSVSFDTSIFNNPFFVEVEQSSISIPTVDPGVERNSNPFLAVGGGTAPSVAATSAATSPYVITLPSSSSSTTVTSEPVSVLSSSPNQ